ncbi:hypothetical protein, partial [Streptococcus suis]|uniref:hypothetical protein n=1 Tax=Streptococcus suis TaxID=1307 RepID=UPI0038B974E7
RTCAYGLIIHRINPFAMIPENAEITRLISYLLQPYGLVAYPPKSLSVIAMHGWLDQPLLTSQTTKPFFN